MMSQLCSLALSRLAPVFQTFFFGPAIVSEVRGGNEGSAPHSNRVFIEWKKCGNGPDA